MFHLLFLSQFGSKLEKRDYALKGGCNLRFFFGSPRYSEDMDLDVREVPVHKLQTRVNDILGSSPFVTILRAHGIEIANINEHKQTQTTQRWKLGLAVPGIHQPIPTKIEFSRRGMCEGEVAFDVVSTILTSGYEMQPVMTSHYTKFAAFMQKIQALADRKATQARDVFDLHLLCGISTDGENLPPHFAQKIAQAKDNLMTIDYDVFGAQVRAFLNPQDQEAYDEEAWDSIRLHLYEQLEGLLR
jgi:predicted nucleotidyltransferase component of viral defense system